MKTRKFRVTYTFSMTADVRALTIGQAFSKARSITDLTKIGTVKVLVEDVDLSAIYRGTLKRVRQTSRRGSVEPA